MTAKAAPLQSSQTEEAMTRHMRLAAWGFAAFSGALAVAFGPLFAGYLLAGAAFALIAVLMGMQIALAIDNWSLEHSWRYRDRH